MCIWLMHKAATTSHHLAKVSEAPARPCVLAGPWLRPWGQEGWLVSHPRFLLLLVFSPA